jgi:hypothetical protein
MSTIYITPTWGGGRRVLRIFVLQPGPPEDCHRLACLDYANAPPGLGLPRIDLTEHLPGVCRNC